jgi:hypothetical protein
MRNQHPLDWPSPNFVERHPRRGTIEGTRLPIIRCTRIGADDPTMPSKEAAPPFEAGPPKISDRISERGRVTTAVKEHDLSQRKASVHDDPVDVSRPVGLSRIPKSGIED